MPKLAECAAYLPAPFAGASAERGTAMDEAMREAMAGDSEEVDAVDPNDTVRTDINRRALGGDATALNALPSADREAVEWAIQTMRAHCGDHQIFTSESDCKITIPLLPVPGTTDALVPSLLRHYDLKSGMIRNYREQMASYAWGNMVRYFADEWTATLLFADERAVISETFTIEQAEAIVAHVVARYNYPVRTATPCQYCTWCALRFTCRARLELAASAGAFYLAEGLEPLYKEPARLAAFLDAAAALEDFRKEARAKGTEIVKAGATLPGYTLRNKIGNEFVPWTALQAHADKIGLPNILSAVGSLSGKKVRDLWALTVPDEPIPADLIQRSPGSTFIQRDRKKKEKERAN